MLDLLCYQARVLCRLEAVVYNPEEAQQLEATVGSEKAEVQRCRERVDDLSSHLPGIHTSAMLDASQQPSVKVAGSKVCLYNAGLGFVNDIDDIKLRTGEWKC